MDIKLGELNIFPIHQRLDLLAEPRGTRRRNLLRFWHVLLLLNYAKLSF